MGFEVLLERIRGLGWTNGRRERVPDHWCCNTEWTRSLAQVSVKKLAEDDCHIAWAGRNMDW